MARIVGTDEYDLLIGTAAADRIDGLGGGDILGGEEGPDRINGGAGADYIYGGAGDDVGRGGAGQDSVGVFFADAGDDLYDGGGGADHLQGGQGDDTLLGGAGGDLLVGDGYDFDGFQAFGPGRDRLEGGDGRDALVADRGGDTLTGGAGGDLFDVPSVISLRHLPYVLLPPGEATITDFARGGDHLALAFRDPETLETHGSFADLDTDRDGALDDGDAFVSVRAVTLDGQTRTSTVIDLGGYDRPILGDAFTPGGDTLTVFGVTGLTARDFAGEGARAEDHGAMPAHGRAQAHEAPEIA